MGQNCCKIKQDDNDSKEFYPKEEQIKYETFGDTFKTETNFKSIPRVMQEEDVNKLINIIKQNLYLELNEEIKIEEISPEDFDKEIEKNKLIERILNTNKYELDNIFYEGDEKVYKINPIKYSNKKGEIEYYLGTYDKKGNLCGKGIFISKEGNLYNGTFDKGLFNGKGILIDINGNYYLGDWKDGKCEGKGQIIYNDKILYEGDFMNNEKNGNGIEHFEDDSIYKGQFLNGEKSGFGKYIFSDGSFYEGEFKNNLFNGNGFFKWSDGRYYKGDFSNGLINGKGVNFWNDGSNYNGNYFHNVKQGEGVYSWKNGNKFIGNFVNNEPHGDGCFAVGDNKYNVKFNYGKIVYGNKIDSESTTNRTDF